ncbi:MAG: hypothetical protein BWY85_00445 [Firmicutes bacterium ADurb.Bin506]|nr:MAG: hypothetical protein BWY85_00445 [Firmicutes bacterium ADurb.Bin506]
MKIVAAVNYFDEPLEHTNRLLQSISGFVHEVVLVDGAYRLFPHTDPRTDPDRIASIVGTGNMLGLVMNVVAPDKAWENQTTKRSYLMNLAASHGDFVLVIDADEWIDRERTDIEKIRYKLAMHQPDAVAVCLDTPGDGNQFNLGTQSPQMSTSVHGKGIERLYRSMRDFTIGPVHHGSVSAVNEMGLRVGLRSRKQENVGMEQPVKLDAKEYFRIVNSTWDRGAKRLHQKNKYGQRRAAAKEDA